MKRQNGLTLVELIVLIAVLAVVVVILYPVFAKPDRRPRGIVRDGVNKPMPGAVLRFRDRAGRVIAVLTADKDGEFRRPGLLDLSRETTVDGFALTRETHFTGGTECVYFSPLGTQTAFVHDGEGRPIAGVGVTFQPDDDFRFVRPDEPEGLTDEGGIVAANGLPVGARYGLDCWDDKYAQIDVKIIASPQAVRYDVTMVLAAVIAGRLIGANGRPLKSYSVFTERVPWTAGVGQTQSDATTDSQGRFRLTGLRPGTYRLIASPFPSEAPYRPEDIFASRFTLANGQTVDVTLQYRKGYEAIASHVNRP